MHPKEPCLIDEETLSDATSDTDTEELTASQQGDLDLLDVCEDLADLMHAVLDDLDSLLEESIQSLSQTHVSRFLKRLDMITSRLLEVLYTPE